MAKTGWIETFNAHLRDERKAIERHQAVPTAAVVVETRKQILVDLTTIGKTGDAELILAVEKRLLEQELELYANSPVMVKSLENALAGIERVEALLPMVDDPVRYRLEDRARTLPRNRVGSLPRDEARQFFRAHDLRLVNMDKSRLDGAEKAIVEARRQNIRIAEKAYIQKQEQALGIVRKDKGPEPALSR